MLSDLQFARMFYFRFDSYLIIICIKSSPSFGIFSIGNIVYAGCF